MTHPRPGVDEDDFENVRKRQIDDDQHQSQNGSFGKRPRLSNGYENGFESTPKSPPVEMDVDEDQIGDENAYPSPEQVPSPAIVTTGPDTGTQIDKTTELGPETTFLDLSDESSAKNAVLLQCDFNPQDPTILAVAGTDALARMWTLSRTTPVPVTNYNDMDTDEPSPRRPPYLSLLDEGAPPTTNVTSLSWTSDGKLIAVASEPIDDTTAKIDIWSQEGTPIASLTGLEASILCLKWNPLDTLLLVLSPISITAGVLITVWLPTTQERRQFSLSGLNGNEQELQAVWTSNEEFVICGGDMLQAFHCSEGEILPLRKYETREGHALSKVAFDHHLQLLATASDAGMVDVGVPSESVCLCLINLQIWDQQGHGRSFNAHQGLITALVWQPYQGLAPLSDDTERLLASSGEDYAISIWNARSPAKPKSSMTMTSAIIGLAFTPDGAFIAGATVERIWIWKVDDVHMPRATWTRGPEVGLQTPRSHDSVADEDQHCLCWDANGQKLAYGVNSQVGTHLSF